MLHTQYCSGAQVKKHEMGGACSTYGGERGVDRVLMGKPEGKRPLRKPIRRLEININMDL